MAKTLLEYAKAAIRVSHTALDEEEVTPLIKAAIKELKLAGVKTVDESDPLIIRAVQTYCKANFGYDNPDSEKLTQAFESLKSKLTQAGEYSGEME